MNKGLIVVNFGGPRDLEEVESFLIALLTDEEVIRTPFPRWIESRFFRYIAKKRAQKVREEYRKIGGKSPIFEDTELFAKELEMRLGVPVLTFHRYLVDTHQAFLEKIAQSECREYIVFPMFPQFSFVTTGSIARFFDEKMDTSYLNWIASYAIEKNYIDAFVNHIKFFLEDRQLKEEECSLVFSAHGLPEKYILEGDPYQRECEGSFKEMSIQFPRSSSFLSYQSQFGRSKWIGPSTAHMCETIADWIGDKKHVVFIPLSFTSDHIETLFEIEEQYVGLLLQKGFSAYRCPALGMNFIDAAYQIIVNSTFVANSSLIRKNV